MILACADFLGTWRLDRTIDDALTQQRAQFVGAASIVQGDKDWQYSGTGTLTLAQAKPMTAERSYIWRPHPKGFDIYFADARFFHHLEFGEVLTPRIGAILINTM